MNHELIPKSVEEKVQDWIKTWDNLDDYEENELILGDFNHGKQLLTFMLGNEKYSFDILSVRELLSNTIITHIPNMPNYIKGMLNLRGVIVPVVDLRVKFGLSEGVYGKYTVTMIIDSNEKLIGVTVDSVSDVIFIEHGQIAPPMENFGIIDAEFIKGIANIGGELLMLLDIETMFSTKQLQAFVSEDGYPSNLNNRREKSRAE